MRDLTIAFTVFLTRGWFGTVIWIVRKNDKIMNIVVKRIIVGLVIAAIAILALGLPVLIGSF